MVEDHNCWLPSFRRRYIWWIIWWFYTVWDQDWSVSQGILSIFWFIWFPWSGRDCSPTGWCFAPAIMQCRQELRGLFSEWLADSCGSWYCTGADLSRLQPGGIMMMIVLTIYYGFSSAGIDNWGHIGGLLAGFSATVILYHRNRQKYWFCEQKFIYWKQYVP